MIIINPKEAIVVFGSGDIRVSTAASSGSGSLDEFVLSSGDYRPIGSLVPVPPGTTVADLKEPMVRLLFSRVTSVDVVISQLTRLKETMIKAGRGQPVSEEIHDP